MVLIIIQTPIAEAQIVEIESTTDGFLPPRMDSTQRNTIAAPIEGTMIFNTSTSRINYYENSQGWVELYPDPHTDITDYLNYLSGGIQSLLEAGETVQSLLDDGVSLRAFLLGGLSPETLVSEGGITVQQLLDTGETFESLLDGGITIFKLYQAGETVQTLLDADVPPLTLLNNGVTVQQLLDAGQTVQDLLENGLHPLVLLDNGQTVQSLLDSGASVRDLLTGDVPIQILLDGGVLPLTILNESIPTKEFIGLNYAGGIIFHIRIDGTGLVSAPTDQSTGAIWGCFGNDIDADQIGLGGGAQNTTDIEAACTEVGTAADICANLTFGGYSDWYLPSIGELSHMFSNIGQAAGIFGSPENVGSFAPIQYWSSTEVRSPNSPNIAWIYDFNTGNQGSTWKHITHRVRAIRAF